MLNPFRLCTAETASTFFPHWIWMGRKWRITDEIYYKYPACIPFLSMWYPPSYIASKIAKFLTLDAAFRFYAYFILLHYLLASILAYKVMGLFGAITFTYAGYCVKPQQPCIPFTLAWMPGMLLGGPAGALSFGMAILGGYWPILIYFAPVAALVNPSCLWGLLIGLPQIIPFLWYWPKSVRHKQNADRGFGRLPWQKLKDLFIPTQSRGITNGVQFPEVEMCMGIAILFVWKASWWWGPLIYSILVCIGWFPQAQRISARALILASFCVAYISCKRIHEISLDSYLGNALILIQSLALLRNSSIYPSFPFSQWWDRPSRLYSKRPKSYNWPFLTGYLENRRISEYQGAFRLA